MLYSQLKDLLYIVISLFCFAYLQRDFQPGQRPQQQLPWLPSRPYILWLGKEVSSIKNCSLHRVLHSEQTLLFLRSRNVMAWDHRISDHESGIIGYKEIKETKSNRRNIKSSPVKATVKNVKIEALFESHSKIFRTMLKNALKLMTVYVAKILYQREYCLLILKSGASKKND